MKFCTIYILKCRTRKHTTTPTEWPRESNNATTNASAYEWPGADQSDRRDSSWRGQEQGWLHHVPGVSWGSQKIKNGRRKVRIYFFIVVNGSVIQWEQLYAYVFWLLFAHFRFYWNLKWFLSVIYFFRLLYKNFFRLSLIYVTNYRILVQGRLWGFYGFKKINKLFYIY